MFNQVILVGNLGQTPEMRYTPTGQAVTSFSLATNRVWVDTSGERQTKTIWFKVTCWRKLAETVSQHMTKGQQIMIVGELEEPRAYTDREGNPKASIEVTAATVKFLEKKLTQGDGGQRLPESLDELSEVPF